MTKALSALCFSFLVPFVVSLDVSAASETTKNLVKPSVDPKGASQPATPLDEERTDKIVKVPTASDDEKTARVLNRLAAQSGWFPQLRIAVSSGMVTLEGHVSDADQLTWLAKTADRMPSVIAVINKATVDEPAVGDFSPAWKELMRLVNEAKKALPLIFLAVVMFGFLFFISQYIYLGLHALWGRHISNPFLLSTVTKITMVPIWALLFYLVLQTAGLSGLATTIIGGTGAVGIVLGFAFKDIAENYLSGLLLAIRSPFTKGDDVTVAGYDGYVQALNMRGTTILGYDGTLVLIPNSLVIQSVIKNRTTNPRSRLAFTIGVGYTTNAGRAIELIYESFSEIKAILQEPAPLVFISDLNPSALVLQARFWIDGSKDSSDKTRSAAIANAKEILLKNGIAIPDSGREVILTDKPALSTQGDSEDRRLSRETGETHDEQIKRLADGVDLMKANADQSLMKSH